MLLAGTSTLWEACSPWARKALFLGLCTKCTLTRQDAYRNPNQHSIKLFRSVQKCWQLKLSFDASSLLQVPPTTHPGWIANTCLQKQDCISHFTKTIYAGWQVQLGHSVVLQTCTHHQEFLYANNFQILKSVAQLQGVLVSTRDCILPRNGSKEPCSCQDSYQLPSMLKPIVYLFQSFSVCKHSSTPFLTTASQDLWRKRRMSPHWPHWFYSWHSCCMLLDPASINLGSSWIRLSHWTHWQL